MNAFEITANDNCLNVVASAFGGDTHRSYEMASKVNVVSLVTTSIIAKPVMGSPRPEIRDITVDLGSIEERFKVTAAPKRRVRGLKMPTSSYRVVGDSAPPITMH